MVHVELYESRLMVWMRGFFGQRLGDSETLCSPCHGDVEPAKQKTLKSCRRMAAIYVNIVPAHAYVHAFIAYRVAISVASIVYSDWEQDASIVFEH
jgi:hypothetical protein